MRRRKPVDYGPFIRSARNEAAVIEQLVLVRDAAQALCDHVLTDGDDAPALAATLRDRIIRADLIAGDLAD